MASNNYPIVLAHGIARFDELRNTILKKVQLLMTDMNVVSDRTHYFRRIRSHLINHKIDTYYANVSFASDVSVRARELAQNIQDVLDDGPHDKVHIIAHSMGGLDSRYMLVNVGLADKVASLTTIGTPHLGTSYAVHGLNHGGELVVKTLMDALGIDLTGFLTLTPEERLKFNKEAENAEAKNDVIYHVYASSQERERLRSFLVHPWDVISRAEGPNDGLVSVKSQLWNAELVADDGTRKTIHRHDFPVRADHSNEIGWWDVNELPDKRWWHPTAIKRRREYEGKIRDAYLQMALEVRGESSA